MFEVINETRKTNELSVRAIREHGISFDQINISEHSDTEKGKVTFSRKTDLEINLVVNHDKKEVIGGLINLSNVSFDEDRLEQWDVDSITVDLAEFEVIARFVERAKKQFKNS